MAKIIDDETLDNVCVLAKLSLDENTREKTREDMQKMLDYVDKLNELETALYGLNAYVHPDYRQDLFCEIGKLKAQLNGIRRLFFGLL